jgi:hypothetical protein
MFAVILTVVIIGFSLIIAAQETANTAKTWARVYYGPDLVNAYINSGQQQIRETPDGGYIAVANYAPSGSSKRNIWILKIDSSGDLAWQQTYGAAGDDYVNAVAVSSDGGYMLAGYSSSYDSGYGDNALIMKIDAQGGIVWQNHVGFKTSGDKRFSMVQQTADGGYIAVGEAAGSNNFVMHAFIAKLDGAGNVQWWKMYGDGDAYPERAFGVQQTPDGGFIVSGSSNNYNAWIFKLDSQGVLKWQKGYTVGNSIGMVANSVHLTSDGGYVASGGYVDSATSRQEAYIMKLDANGVIQQQKSFKPSTGSGSSTVFAIEETKDSGYIAIGYLSNYPWLMKLDQDWNILWQHSHYGTWYGTYTDYFTSLQPASDGGYMMAGTAVSFDPDKKRQAFLLKTDSEGNLGGCAADLVHGIAATVLTKTIVSATVSGKEQSAKFSASSGPISALNNYGSKGTVCVDKDPDIAVSPSTLDFAVSELPGESSKTLTIANTGEGDLIISGMTITGADAAAFTQANDCSTVVPGGSCSAIVTFSVSSAGTRTASLSISSNDPDTPEAVVSLSGVTVDTTAPVSTVMITGIPGNHNWYVSDVTINITATDSSQVKEIHYQVGGSETVVPGDAAVLSLVSNGTHTVNYYAVDNAGNEEKPHHTMTIMIDKSLPDISASASPPPNSAGWNKSDVTVTFTCNDSPSGIAQCPGPVLVSTEGSGQNVSGAAIDQAGNQASTSVQVNIDKTPPTIAASASKNPNAYGWNNTDVTVTFTCSDALSGVASCPSPVTVTTEGAGQVITATAVDKAGNSSTAAATLNIDKTPPTITAAVSENPSADGWYNTDVTVTFTCKDTLSGIASCPSPTKVTTEGTAQVITGTAVDKAGNAATASVTLNIDKTPPLIGNFAASPANIWPPNLKMVKVLIVGAATDGASGVASTSIKVTDEYGIYNMTVPGFGSAIQLQAWRRGTDRDGRHYTITAVVTDKAGNQATATTTVLVPHHR